MQSIGALDQRIIIERTQLRNDGAGGYQTFTQPNLQLWAQVRRTNASESTKFQAIGMAVSCIFVIRYREDISKSHTIIYRGQRYKIVGEPTFNARDTFLELAAELIES